MLLHLSLQSEDFTRKENAPCGCLFILQSLLTDKLVHTLAGEAAETLAYIAHSHEFG